MVSGFSSKGCSFPFFVEDRKWWGFNCRGCSVCVSFECLGGHFVSGIWLTCLLFVCL